jgi:hypothetical protein
MKTLQFLKYLLGIDWKRLVFGFATIDFSGNKITGLEVSFNFSNFHLRLQVILELYYFNRMWPEPGS